MSNEVKMGERHVENSYDAKFVRRVRILSS
jgi:hypothetical protein